MPKPNLGESRDEFVSRCIPIVLADGAARDGDQAIAICNSIFEQSEKVTVLLDDNGKPKDVVYGT